MTDFDVKNAYPCVQASYQLELGSRYRGNPFAEALPLAGLIETKSSLSKALAHYPPEPTAADRRLPRMARIGEINNILDIIYPRPAYEKIGDSILANLLEAYVTRNPVTAEDRRQRHQIAQLTPEQCADLIRCRAGTSLPFGKGWRRTGLGYLLTGVTGTGKSTLLKGLLQYLAVVIEHTEYGGQPLICKQLPVLYVQVSHDATLRTFCQTVLDNIDYALGATLYGPRGKAARTIGALASVLFRATSAVSLGELFIDDLQNLRSASPETAETSLNLFSLIMEIAGISVTAVGTPALGPLIEDNARNTRKLTSGGQGYLEAMARDSLECKNFQDRYWQYQYTSTFQPLTKKLRNAWFAADAGHPAFCSTAFMCAQRAAVGRGDAMNVELFGIVATEDMALLRPAVEALLSGKPEDLLRFDDLKFSDEIELLQRGRIADRNGHGDARRTSAPSSSAQSPAQSGAQSKRNASKESTATAAVDGSPGSGAKAKAKAKPGLARAGSAKRTNKKGVTPRRPPPEDPLSLTR